MSMNAPRTPPETVITIRLSPDEKRAIQRAAKKAGHKYPAQWVRELALRAISA